MPLRLGPTGAIVRPSPASRAPNSVRAAAASRVHIDLTDDAPSSAARPLLPNHARRTTDPPSYAVYAHHHYPWRRYGEGEHVDFIGVYARLEEATHAARCRYRRARDADGWEYLWDQVGDELRLKAKLEDYEDDVETLTVTISPVRQRSARHGMRAEHRIEEEAWREELRRHLGRGLREDLKNELREELEDEVREDLKNELREELEDEVREGLKEKFGEELYDELREEVKEEMKEELDEELREEVKVELREEWDDELREELKEELEEEIKEELREELSEKQWVYVLTVEHRVEGELQESETAGVHLDLERAEVAVGREYIKCCNDVQVTQDFRHDRRLANGLLSYELVWEGEGDETWNICLEEKLLQ